MYSNQKDQINLEDVYNRIHSENINEQITPPDSGLATGVALGGMIFLSFAMDYISQKYQQFKLKGLSQRILNKINSSEGLKTKLNNLKKEADDSGNEEYTKQIKAEISQIIKSDNEFRAKVPDNQEDSIIKEIVNLLPKNFSGKDNDALTREVKNNFSNAQYQDQQRRRMNLQPVGGVRV